MKNILAAVTLLATASFSSAADLSLGTPLEGKTISDGRVDMSVYFEDLNNGFEVVVTYVVQTEPSNPGRLLMLLDDGDRVSFGLPGVSGKVYTFSRDADLVKVETSNVWTQIATK